MKAELHWIWAWHIKERLRRQRERFFMGIAWALPKELVMWCAVRLIAYATAGEYDDTVVPELRAMDALKRWRA